MISVPLSEFASVILNASGNGTASIGPNAHGVTWKLTAVSVRVSTATKTPTCLVYCGRDTTDANFVDGTYTGNQNSTANVNGQALALGDKVFAVWSGGDVGAQATVTVTGTKEIG